MKGVKFKDQTNILNKPENMADEECYALPVKITTNGEYPAIESVWELSDDDLELINKTKRIRIGIIGNTMTPIYLLVEKIPEGYEENELSNAIADITKNSLSIAESASRLLQISNDYKRDSFIIKKLSNAGYSERRITPIILMMNK